MSRLQIPSLHSIPVHQVRYQYESTKENTRKRTDSNNGWLISIVEDWRIQIVIVRIAADTPQLSVAKLEGFALGGGSELAMACDLRAAKRNAKFGYVQSKISVTPGWGTTGRLFGTVGRAKALEMLALGSLLTADQAKDLGLVNLVFDKDEDFAGWIQRFIRMDVDVIRSVKRLGIIYGSNSNDSNSNSMGEREVFARNWGSPAHLRALEAGRKMK